MADSETTSVQIATDGPAIDAWELSYFLYLFRAVYVAASEKSFSSEISSYAPLESVHQFADSIRRELPAYTGFDLTTLARKETFPDLKIVDIRRENPLEIVFEGIAVALAVAIIISGGEFKSPGFRVKLHPLGTGIAKLREAFGRRDVPRRKR